MQTASWNLANVRFSRGSTFQKWGMLLVNTPKQSALDKWHPTPSLQPGALLQTCANEFAKYDVRLEGPPEKMGVDLEPGRDEASQDSSKKILDERFAGMRAAGVELAIVVLPEFDRWLYSRIKFCADVKYGIHTVCCIGRKLQTEDGQSQFLGNLALKLNIKGGGRNHTVQDSSNPLMKELPHTMLVGIDVTHPSPGSSEGAPSIAGVVASYESDLQQWPASLRRQTSRTEMVADLAAMLGERLDTWRRKTRGPLPSKIIVYRDGVSEGQYQTVLDTELVSFRTAFEAHYGAKNKWPKLAIIVVGKRHHTRFYPTKVQDAANRTFNPLPGTIVDRGVTDAVLYDFYLQAHAGIQGTTRPAHYVVIYDELNLKANALQNFTHTLCYLFNRATKAVSICPPAYYADLLCERARMYLYNTMSGNANARPDDVAAELAWTGQIHPNLRDSTFYI